MTYRELREKLSNLSEEQLDDDAIVFFTDECEFIGIDKTNETTDDDVLHEGHFYLISN